MYNMPKILGLDYYNVLVYWHKGFRPCSHFADTCHSKIILVAERPWWAFKKYFNMKNEQGWTRGKRWSKPCASITLVLSAAQIGAIPFGLKRWSMGFYNVFCKVWATWRTSKQIPSASIFTFLSNFQLKFCCFIHKIKTIFLSSCHFWLSNIVICYGSLNNWMRAISHAHTHTSTCTTSLTHVKIVPTT